MGRGRVEWQWRVATAVVVCAIHETTKRLPAYDDSERAPPRLMLLLLTAATRTHTPTRAHGGSAANARPKRGPRNDDDRRRHRRAHRHAFHHAFHLLALRERHAIAIAAQLHMMTAKAAMPDASDEAPTTTDGAGETRLGSSME